MKQQDKFGSKYLSHYGIRARDLGPMIDWYKKFFNATVEFDAGIGVFMTFDDEHHRLVIWSDDETNERAANSAGVDHIGIGLPDHGSLVENYERLKGHGILPTLSVNHHFTTSLYYNDPDGNEVEFSVDNFPTKDECSEFVRSEKMAAVIKPPYFGDPFDADELATMYHAGASHAEMAAIGRNGHGAGS